MNSVVGDLASIGKVESSIKLIIATIFSILFAVIGIYMIYKKKFKGGFIFLIIAGLIYGLNLLNNKLVKKSNTFAAFEGAEDIAQIL